MAEACLANGYPLFPAEQVCSGGFQRTDPFYGGGWSLLDVQARAGLNAHFQGCRVIIKKSRCFVKLPAAI